MNDPAESPRARPERGSSAFANGLASPAGLLAWLPWVAAAAFAVLAGFLGEAYFAVRTELIGLREQSVFSSIESQSLMQRLEAERILAARRIADLTAGVSDQDLLAQCDFISLHAPAAASPAPEALIVWNPSRQEGVLLVHHLPALKTSYHLWIRDSRYPAPCDAGGFTAGGGEAGVRLFFKPDRPVAASARFYVTEGRGGGGPIAEGPVVLTSR